MFLDNAHWNFFTAERNFKWSVTPCRGFDGQLCYPNYRSDQGQFITSGTPPQKPEITSPRDKAGDKLIPITFEWDPVPKVKSYVIEIPNIGVVISGIEAKKIFDHPDLQLGETYQWRVKSCLHPNGEICGQWSPFQSFTIFTLGIPTLSYPPNGQEIYTYHMPITLSWDPVEHANFYEKIIYFQGEEIKRDILSATSSLFFDPGHRGNFTWKVRACLDSRCLRASEFSPFKSFSIKGEIRPGEQALVPCGLDFNCPTTPWDDTKPCEPKHIFHLLYNIIDFVLWRVIPILLVVLVVYTGAMFYLSISTEETEPMSKARALWRSAGIGFGLIFMSWFIVTWTLWIFGYQLGPWQYIPL